LENIPLVRLFYAIDFYDTKVYKFDG